MLRVAISRSVAVALIAALGLLFLQPKGASAAATLTLTPNIGPTGTVVAVTGTGYGASKGVVVYFNGVPVATTTSTGTGDISTSFTVPTIAANTYTVTAASVSATMSASFTVSNAPAPSITLTPTTGPPGTVVTVTGSGFGASQTAGIYFNGVLIGTTTTTATGTLPANTTFAVPNVSNGTYTVTVLTATRAAVASFTVGPIASGSVTLSKFVTVNGLGYSTTGVARPGDTLTYELKVVNNTSGSLNVVATDTISAGQTVLAPPGFPCAFTTGSTLSCSFGTIPAGATALLFISVVVNSGFTGAITNQASVTSTVTGTTTAGPSATSNTTIITVGSVVPVTGTFLLCGPITAYTAATATANGSITVSGATFTIAAGSTAVGVVPGTNMCILATVNSSGQLTAITGSANLAAVSVVCGTFTIAAAGFVNVTGILMPVFPGTSFVFTLIVGASYCFVLNANGQIIAAILGIPTRAILPYRHHPFWFERIRNIEL